MKVKGHCIYCGIWEEGIEDFICETCIDMDKWKQYEFEKAKLVGLTPGQYEQATKELCKRLGI